MTDTLAVVPQRGARVPALANLRRRRLLTIRQLAERADVGTTTIARAERGEHIDLATIARLAKALDVPPDTLFGGEEGES